MARAERPLMDNCHTIVRRGKLKRNTIGARRLAGGIIRDAAAAGLSDLTDNAPLNDNTGPLRQRDEFVAQYGDYGV